MTTESPDTPLVPAGVSRPGGFDFFTPDPEVLGTTAETEGRAKRREPQGHAVPVQMPPEQPPVTAEGIAAALSQGLAVSFQVNRNNFFSVVTMTPERRGKAWRLRVDVRRATGSVEKTGGVWKQQIESIVPRSWHVAWPKNIGDIERLIQQATT